MKARASLAQRAIEYLAFLLGVDRAPRGFKRDRGTGHIEANEMRAEQDRRPRLDRIQRHAWFDHDQTIQSCLGGPPQQAALQHAARIGLEMLSRNSASFLFRPLR